MGEIIDKVLLEEFEDPQNARIALDAIKWRLSKMLPSVYGEKSHLEVTGGLKVETIKDMAPDWMKEELLAMGAEQKRLAGGKVEMIEAGEDDEIEVEVIEPPKTDK